VIAAVFFKETDPIPEGDRLSVERVVADLVATGREAATFADNEAILRHLEQAAQPGDVIVFLSNGAFGGMPQRFAAWVGRGANGLSSPC
jgi:UDP-N-acetylmuramate: L-alanyl-gamma-D-glutamyl-meso-diaminopimelate ligase